MPQFVPQLDGRVAWHWDPVTRQALVYIQLGQGAVVLPANEARDFAMHVLNAAANAEAERPGAPPAKA